VQVFAAALSRLRLRIARPDTNDILCHGTVSALRLGLTAYDGAYVDLAQEQGIALATLDTRMREAAAVAGVAIFVG
jgi:predicted nucleic acid-binding protein